MASSTIEPTPGKSTPSPAQDGVTDPFALRTATGSKKPASSAGKVGSGPSKASQNAGRISSANMAKEAATSATAKQPSKSGRKIGLLIAIALLPLVMIGGYFLGKSHSAKGPKEKDVAKSADDHAEHGSPAPGHGMKGHPPKEDLARVDHLIREGLYPEALKLSRKLAEKSGAGMREKLNYRTALCLEAAGEWNEAAEEYAKIAESDSFGPRVIAAQIGQARCWIPMKRIEDARWLLARLVVVSGNAAMQERPFLGEVFYLRSKLELAEVPPSAAPQPLDAKALATFKSPTVIERYLDWADHEAHAAVEEDEEEPGESLEILRSPRSADQHLVTAQLKEITIPDLLRQLGVKTGLTLNLSADVEARLSGRSLRVEIMRLPLSDVLSALTEPHDVAWSIESETIELTSKTKDQISVDDSRQRARTSIRRAMSAAPDHPAALTQRLALANLDFELGKLQEAIEGYRHLLDDAPHRPQALPAAYNLGLTHLRESNFREARDNFLKVVDRAPSDRWTALAWWWVARTFLDAGEPAKALPALKKAMKYAQKNDVKPVAILGFATAHALMGELVEARQNLRSERKLLLEAPYREMSAFIDSFARFTSAKKQKTTAVAEAEDLLSAIVACGDRSLIGPAGAVLLGQACRELDMDLLLVAPYDRALEHLRGPLALRMTFELAQCQDKTGQTAAAKEKYLALAAVDKGDWGSRSRLRVAEMALRDGNLMDCIRVCKEILADNSTVRDSAFVVLGKAYAKQGDNVAAAECFAGRLPGVTPKH